MAKLSNAVNRTIYNAKYREYAKTGNVVQLISKNSHMSLQICSSQNDPNRLIILGNGQIGPEYPNAHFTVIKDKNGHFRFQNALNFFAMDEPRGVPCVLSEPTTKKPKPYEFIRARNEFRIHEVIGSEEYFSLESVYFAGKYVSITPDGSITVTNDKSDVSTHFCLHLIREDPVNVRPNRISQSRSNSSLNSNASTSGATATAPYVSASGSVPAAGAAAAAASYSSGQSSESEDSMRKRMESEQYAAQNDNPGTASNSGYTEPAPDTTPPAYGNLFPTLPK